jgi:hypothetical protein
MRGVTRSRVLGGAGLVCVAGMFACFFTGLWFQGRKHTLSGIPSNHVPVQEGRHYFFVPRGGGPVDGRPRQPITAEQFQAWEENQQTGAILMALSVPCLIAAVYLGAAADRVRSAAQDSAPGV